MGNNEFDSMNRSRLSKREQKKKRPKKSDKLLNVLIAIVSILIVANLVFLFTKDDEKEVASENKTQAEKYLQGKNQSQKNEEVVSEEGEEEQSSDNTVVPAKNEDQTEEKEQSVKLPTKLTTNKSSDPQVKQEVVDPSWQPTPTKQTGEHVSVYKEGHVDYEEKLVTFRNAVNLEENNVIYWSVRNNGSSNSSIAVISSKDESQKYRISIEWIENEGWKPVKVEELK
ncbi:YrrS family protein [Ureibacillus composti]|nr:YrrS family protein [Ureibacillus composti]